MVGTDRESMIWKCCQIDSGNDRNRNCSIDASKNLGCSAVSLDETETLEQLSYEFNNSDFDFGGLTKGECGYES